MIKKYNVIIMWAWPSWASLWILLAKKKWLKVLVIEKNNKKVHKIWESLLPDSTWRFAQILWIKNDIDNSWFPRKYWASIIWWKSKEPWNVIFDPKLDNYLNTKEKLSDEEIKEIFETDYLHSYQVNRYNFDSIYIKRLKELDIDLHLWETIVDFSLKEEWLINSIKTKYNWEEHTYEADLIVDASWQKSIIWNKLWLKEYNKELWFISYYTYYKDFNFYDKFYSKYTQHIISIDEWWIWVINIWDIVSVWLVTDKKKVSKDMFFEILENNIWDYIKWSKTTDYLWNEADEIYIASDWSYLAKQKYWKNYVLLWDSSGFVDPVLSWWVSFAINSAFLAYKFIIDFFKEDKNIEVFKGYEKLLLKDQQNYYEMAKFWYWNNKSKDSFFWKAREVLGSEAWNRFNKRAFVYLTSWKHYSDKYLKLFEWELNIWWEWFDKTERIEIENLINK